MAKKAAKKKPADPIAKLAARVAALEKICSRLEAAAPTVAAASSELAASAMSAIKTHPSTEPALNFPPPLEHRVRALEHERARHGRLVSELLQENFHRLRGDRLERVRRSLGLSRRPWRDLLPRWLHRLLDERWGL